MNENLIQFDGSNFFNKIKSLSPKTHLTNYDYKSFAEFLTNGKSYKAIYYVGEIKKKLGNKKSEQLYSSQQSLFRNLRRQGIEIKLGYLLLSGNKYHEKGVDVQIAVDITKGAIKNTYKTCYIISSDTDLLPAIELAKEEDKKIIYVGFEKAVSRALSNNCNSYIILKKSQIEKFAIH